MIKKWKIPRVFEDFLVRSENLQLWVQIFIFFSFSFVFDCFPLFFIVFHGFPGFQVPRARKMKKMKFKMKKMKFEMKKMMFEMKKMKFGERKNEKKGKINEK